jgi:repressor LexA
MTKRQKQVLEFMKRFLDDNGYMPSVREICDGMNLASPGSLFKHLTALEKEGVLNRTPGKKRSWHLTERSEEPYFIPVLGQIAAGAPILAEENWEEEIQVDPKMFGFPECFAVRVKGDSMIDAHIGDGDLAVIRPQRMANQGEIVAVLIDGLQPEATLKIFRRKDDTIELRPANPIYKSMYFHGPDTERITILGKLVGVIRSYAT